MNTINDTDPAERLHRELVEQIRARGTFRTSAVERAFATVPRHRFLPGVDLAEAYRPRQVVTKRDADGAALSSASSPNLVADMLEQLDAQPGERVLEVGAATGFNAALLAEIVGDRGSVTTIEIDDDLAQTARHNLNDTGYGHVDVVCADGALGVPARAPFDRIIVTAGAWTIPTAWWDQLTPQGRLVVPVRLHGSGLTRSLPFERTGPDRMVASSALVCGFVPLRGSSDRPTRTVPLGQGVSLAVAADDRTDDAALEEVFTHPAHQVWSTVTISGAQQTSHLDLWLATHDEHYARLSVTRQARDDGLADPTLRWGGAALHDGAASLAYLVLRELDEDTEEIGVIAHGPRAQEIADHLSHLITQWAHTMPAEPTVTARPAATINGSLPPGTLVKGDTVFTVAW